MNFLKKLKDIISKLFGYTNYTKKQSDESQKYNHNIKPIYTSRSIMTAYERKFYNILKKLDNEFNIVPQLNLAAVITKKNKINTYYTDLFRNIDFAIFDKDFNKLLLLIEIDDSTHKKYKRKKRDKRVNNIVSQANIRLIRFYSKYPNEESYVINRVINELNQAQLEENKKNS